MREYIVEYLKISRWTSLGWILIYLTSCFIYWELTIPLEWVMEIPDWPAETRGLFIFYYLFYLFVKCLASYIRVNELNAKKTSISDINSFEKFH